MGMKEIKVTVPKELDDVFELVEQLVIVMKAGGEFATVVDELLAAVTGIDQVPGEVSADPYAVARLGALRAVKMVEILTKKEEVQPVPAAE